MDLRNMWRGWHKPLAVAGQGATAAAGSTSPDELMRLGTAQREQGDYAAASRSLLHAIEIKHDFGEAHHALGLVYLDQGHCEDAADCFQLAVHFAPNLAVVHEDLAMALMRLGRHVEAESACRRGLDLDPQRAGAWFLLGNILKSQHDLEQAAQCYHTAIERNPAFAEAHCQLAYVLFRLGRYEESRASHMTALAVRPDFTEVHHNLGLLLLETGYPEEALARFKYALTLRPTAVETQTCVAHALRDLGRLDEALAQYDSVLSRDPQFGDAVINRCYALLMSGDCAAGWREYERRHAATGTPVRGFPFPEWGGEPLAGRRVLVYAEQGLGDEIMFASCLPDMLERAGHVVIECGTRLAGLFARSFPRATVHGSEKDGDKTWVQAAPPADCQIAIGSLPLHLRSARAAFPGHHGYLAADPARVACWRARLGASAGRLRAGIAWRGGVLRTRQLTRSAPLEHWQLLLSQTGVDFVSLQYGETGGELAQLRERQGVTVHSFGNELADLDELAAAIAALDLIISVDNTVVHLAGALGKPVWVLLPFAPEWRYLRRGASIPWYPSARLFRQPRPREWGPAIAEAAAALRQCVDAGDV